ncbi:MAG: hypothetical protein R2861_05365 [Desulfobacterales bacterium]
MFEDWDPMSRMNPKMKETAHRINNIRAARASRSGQALIFFTKTSGDCFFSFFHHTAGHPDTDAADKTYQGKIDAIHRVPLCPESLSQFDLFQKGFHAAGGSDEHSGADHHGKGILSVAAGVSKFGPITTAGLSDRDPTAGSWRSRTCPAGLD